MGGVEHRVLETARRLTARGHRVVVHTAAALPDRRPLPEGDEPFGGFEIVRYRPEVFRGTFRLFYRPRPRFREVLETQGYPSPVSDWLARRHRSTHALTTGLMGSTLYPGRLTHYLARIAYDHLRGLPTLRRMDAIQVMTADETRWARSHGVRVPIEEIPSPADDSAFEEYDAASAMQKHGLARYVLFLGRLFEEKNPRHLVQAFERVAARFPEVKLVFVGPDQGEREPVLALAKALGLADRVVTTGAVSREEKFALLRGCEFLALPTDYEAQGVVFLEAWAQGRPVVATRVGGVPYVVDEGVNGLLHERGDIGGITRAMETLLADPALCRRMGEAGRKKAQSQYRWSVTIPRLEALYERILAARPDAR